MPLITKPDFTYVWASGGAVVAPNDTKKQQGWVAEAPPFQYDNWLQNRQDQMLAHINQRGIPAWDGLTNYEAGGLSYVQGSDGKVYKSVAASGPSSVVSNPTTDGTDTYWTIAFADVGAFLTQTAGDARYTQRSNNLSDVTNVATARTNLGLGTAATKNAQTSSADTSAGALMAVGAFGLGESNLLTTSDIDAIPTTTFFSITGGNANNPFGSTGASGLNVQESPSYGWQLVGVDGGDFALKGRIKTAGIWSAWRDLWTNGNLPVTTFAKTLLDDADAATARTTLDVYSKVEAKGIAIGVGQTWQDVTASRSINTTYTNTTGRPIQILVQYQDNVTNVGATFKVGSLTRTTGDLGGGSAFYPYWFSAVIPNGDTYSISGGVDLPAWWELR